MSKLEVISTTKADNSTVLSLTPVSQVGLTASYKDLDAAVAPNLRESNELSFRKAVPSRGIKDKTVCQQVIPFEHTDSAGVTKVLYASVSTAYNLPPEAPTDIRMQIIDRAKKNTDSAALVDLVVNNAFPY